MYGRLGGSAVLGALVLLVACGVVQEEMDTEALLRDLGEETGQALLPGEDAEGADAEQPARKHVREMPGVWFGGDVATVEGGRGLPEWLAEEQLEVFFAAETLSYAELFGRVSEILGVPFVVDRSEIRVATESSASEEGGQAAQGGDDAVPWHELLARDFVYAGPPAALLDRLVSEVGLESWEYAEVGTVATEEVDGIPVVRGAEGGAWARKGTVRLRRFAVREVPFHVLAASQEGEALWDEVGRGIGVLCGGVCTATAQPDLGRFLIVGRGYALDRVERYVADQAGRLMEQLYVEVEVFSVRREVSDSFDFDLSVVFGGNDVRTLSLGAVEQVLGSGDEGGGGSESGEGEGIGGLGEAGLQLGMAVVGESEFNGTGAVLAALSTAGESKLVHSVRFLGLNGRTQKIDIGEQRRIKVGETSVGAGDAAGTVLPGDIIEDQRDGMVMEVSLRLLSDQRVALSYKFELSDVLYPRVGDTIGDRGLRSATRLQKLENEAVFPLGTRLLLNAFERTSASAQESGTGDAGIWVLGGGQSEGSEVESLVVSIRPVLLSAGFDRQES